MNERKQPYIQLTLPLSRFDRRDIIRELELPAIQKSILRELNDFAERTGTCFPSQSTLATCCGCSKRTIQAHIDSLEIDGLIIVTPRERSGARGATSNQYAIVWEELAVRTNRTVRTSPNNQVAILTDQSAIVTDQVAIVTDQVAIVADQVAIVADQVADSAPLETTREDTRETTTETEWNVVVVLLGKLGVGKVREAIATARARNATPSEVKAIIERVSNDPSIEPAKRAGAIYNQVCRPTPDLLPPKPKPKLKRPDKEGIRHNLCFREINQKGIRPIDVDHEAIEIQAERIYKIQLAEYEKQQAEINQAFESFATKEPTR